MAKKVKRYIVPILAFVSGSSLIAGVYFEILAWAQGWDLALSQFLLNRWYIIPIWLAFGTQAALYSILRFRLFVPNTSTSHAGALTPLRGVMGTSGGTSVTAMVACCLHHVTDVLPVLGLSAAATFLTRYQRPFMLLGLAFNIIGIIVMLVVLYGERRELGPARRFQPIPEIE